MNILVTGGAGYLGSVLVPKLLARGHRVRVLDVGYFGTSHLRQLRPAVELVRDDLRRVLDDATFADRLLDGCACVIHLAAVSNDPSAELNPELTETVNYTGTAALAEAARKHRARFLFSSSCSVYGEADGATDEEAEPQPLTVYAVSKVKAETALRQLADAAWVPIILRNGTLFGLSPRMRFDLVVNVFGLCSTLYNEVKVFGDGGQWRPFLHVSDCARAFVYFAERACNEYLCYNIANENLRVADVADIFRAINPSLTVTHVPLTDPDLRDYRVSTGRMTEAGFAPRVEVRVGAEQIVEAIIGGQLPDPESIFYRNAKWLKELTQVGNRDHTRLVGQLEALASTYARAH